MSNYDLSFLFQDFQSTKVLMLEGIADFINVSVVFLLL